MMEYTYICRKADLLRFVFNRSLNYRLRRPTNRVHALANLARVRARPAGEVEPRVLDVQPEVAADDVRDGLGLDLPAALRRRLRTTVQVGVCEFVGEVAGGGGRRAVLNLNLRRARVRIRDCLRVSVPLRGVDNRHGVAERVRGIQQLRPDSLGVVLVVRLRVDVRRLRQRLALRLRDVEHHARSEADHALVPLVGVAVLVIVALNSVVVIWRVAALRAFVGDDGAANPDCGTSLLDGAPEVVPRIHRGDAGGVGLLELDEQRVAAAVIVELCQRVQPLAEGFGLAGVLCGVLQVLDPLGESVGYIVAARGLVAEVQRPGDVPAVGVVEFGERRLSVVGGVRHSASTQVYLIDSTP